MCIRDRDKILELDAHGYYMMNILDYLVGNTDRHWENWGLLVDKDVYKRQVQGNMMPLHSVLLKLEMQ